VPPYPAAFEPAVAAFVQLVVNLQGDEHRHADHASAERFIDERGREALRLVLQGWLDIRVAEEPRREVVGCDGVARTHHRPAEREVESLFGAVTVLRDRVGARGATALAPVDSVLNLPDVRFTFGVRERVASEALRGSFDAAVAVVDETTGAAVAKRQAEELVRAAAVDFDAFYEETTRQETSADPGDLLVLSVDGKGVVMRSEGLREGTRKAAAKGVHKLATRLSKGEKKNRKRMATVAAVYDIPAVPRTADDVVGELDRAAARPRPRARCKRVWASLEKTPREVIAEGFAEASGRDPARRRRWIALVDGNATQIREIRHAAKRVGVEVTLVLDFIHVTEYLWAAAWDLFKEGDPAAEKWVRVRQRQVLEGRASTVAAAMRRSATCRKLTTRANIDKAAGYLLAHADMLRYDQYLSAGLPIATGVIEGACRHLVKDRMDITGARWGLAGAEAILRLRSLRSSGDLARYWEFHRAREFERNHASRYDEAEEFWLQRRAA
jgi:hypothetical protein